MYMFDPVVLGITITNLFLLKCVRIITVMSKTSECQWQGKASVAQQNQTKFRVFLSAGCFKESIRSLPFDVYLDYEILTENKITILKY